MSKREIDIHLHRFKKQCENFENQLTSLESLVEGRVTQLRKTLTSLETLEKQLSDAVDEYKTAAEKDLRRPLREAQKRIEELESTRGGPPSPCSTASAADLQKAKTIALFESILFAIENWSDDGQIATDVRLASQSVLFPTIYERLMQGEEDYYIKTVPASALEVVDRGRRFVRYIRNVTDKSLVDPGVWKDYAHEVQNWWVADALPLLYGARDSRWNDDKHLSLVEVTEWRDQPASRALHFPLIFDGMELVKKFPEEIRENTGIPEFNKHSLTTRLNPDEPDTITGDPQ